VKKEVAMTGEITLRGRVLPIGGLKEKLLAAHRSGIKIVIIPKENESDLRDIPASVLESINVVKVETADDVLNTALVGAIKNNDTNSVHLPPSKVFTS
jgi:ATP-dependent Lon protease